MNTAAKIIIVLAVFLAGFYFGQRQATAPAEINDTTGITAPAAIEPAENAPITVSMSIDYGEGKEPADFENVSVPALSSVFDLLRDITSGHDIALDYEDYGGDLGIMVEGIGGVANDFSANRYWQYWLNGQYAPVGAGAQELGAGDRVEWKFTEGQMIE